MSKAGTTTTAGWSCRGRRLVAGIRVRTCGFQREECGRTALVSTIRSLLTTTSPPGMPITTSIGRPTISSTRLGSSAPTTSVRAATAPWRATSECCSQRTAFGPVLSHRCPRQDAHQPVVHSRELCRVPTTQQRRRHSCRIRQSHHVPPTASIPSNSLAFGGTWTVHSEEATAGRNATLGLQFTANDVYLVMSGLGSVDVSFNGRPPQNVHVTGIPKLYTLFSSRPSGQASSR